jgi:hypothetical protein
VFVRCGVGDWGVGRRFLSIERGEVGMDVEDDLDGGDGEGRFGIGGLVGVENMRSTASCHSGSGLRTLPDLSRDDER